MKTIEVYRTSTPEQQAFTAKEEAGVIERLRRDNRLTNDVKLILFGKIDALSNSGFISYDQSNELRSLIGEDFIAANSQSLDLATFGCLEDEIDEAA